VQKPFTAEELSEFVRRLLIKRQARVEAQQQPTVRIVAPTAAETAPANEYCIPGGAFVAPGHTWARIEPGGQVRIGIDDFARKAVGSITQVRLPEHGLEVRQGEALFTLKQGGEQIQFLAPLSGKVMQTNDSLEGDPQRVLLSPYDRGWIVRLQPSDLAAELPSLQIGNPVIGWYQDEIARLRKAKNETSPIREQLEWNTLEKLFLKP